MANKNMGLEKTKMPEQAPDIRNKNFEEVALGYTAEMAVEEANRCLGCKNMPCVSGCPVNVRRQVHPRHQGRKRCHRPSGAVLRRLAH